MKMIGRPRPVTVTANMRVFAGEGGAGVAWIGAGSPVAASPAAPHPDTRAVRRSTRVSVALQWIGRFMVAV